jgi:hypothetical protein
MSVLARQLFDPSIFSVITSGGAIGIGWGLAFYTAGTATPITTWNAATSGSANSNPVESDGNGRFPQIWIDEGQNIKWILSDNNGVTQDTIDNVPIVSIPAAPDASLTNFLANTAPLPLANGGTNATSAVNALANLGALPAVGGTVTGNIVRSGKGATPFFHDTAMVNPEIFITATGATDPRSGAPGQIWLRY